MTATPFAEWLDGQLKLRRMSQAEFCRRGNISPGMVSQFLVGERGAGEGLYKAVSDAFDLPLVEVYKLAGVLPDEGNGHYSAEDTYILELLKGLPEGDKKLVVDFIEMLKARRR